MDIVVPDNWLKDFLKTNASSKEIASSLALCGPSVERVVGTGKSLVYLIEVTTNRIDTASIYGIAREASAILPRFNLKTKLLPLKIKSAHPLKRSVKYLDVDVDHNLCPRFSAVLIKNVVVKDSPKYIKERLTLVGERPINNVVDISNYVMHELGQPLHTFDYDKIIGAKMILRESKRDEKITTLDGKTHKLPGGDIVIEDGSGKIIDLAGIMGGQNSAVDTNTKNVLLFVQNYNPAKIRRTSMSLAHRTLAATLFEKGIDPELVELTLRRAVDLFEETTNGNAEPVILDLYPHPYKQKTVHTTIDFIEARLGITLSSKDINQTLEPLGFDVEWKDKNINISIPSYRSQDINIPEDIVEEVARIYGYFNLPSTLMTGKIPENKPLSTFDLESKIKNLLKGYGGNEVYTSSLVQNNESGKKSLGLKNPLSAEATHLRSSMKPSIVRALQTNTGFKDAFFMFEISNIYIPNGNSLPEERMILSVGFSNFKYRNAKGIIETLFAELGIEFSLKIEDAVGFLPNHCLKLHKSGEFGVMENGIIYFGVELTEIARLSTTVRKYTSLPKYPAQIEDMTVVFPSRTVVSDVIEKIENTSDRIAKVELKDIYNDSYTFRIWYQDPDKTLENKDVELVRKNVINSLSKNFSASIG